MRLIERHNKTEVLINCIPTLSLLLVCSHLGFRVWVGEVFLDSDLTIQLQELRNSEFPVQIKMHHNMLTKAMLIFTMFTP